MTNNEKLLDPEHEKKKFYPRPSKQVYVKKAFLFKAVDVESCIFPNIKYKIFTIIALPLVHLKQRIIYGQPDCF